MTRVEAFVEVRRVMFDLGIKNEDCERLLVAILAYGHAAAGEMLNEFLVGLPEARRVDWYLNRL